MSFQNSYHIDIKPGSFPNSINLNSKGNGQPLADYKDINGDGFIDVIIHFTTNEYQKLRKKGLYA
jgi:hypothetical protein